VLQQFSLFNLIQHRWQQALLASLYNSSSQR
jgi:hypothetical protein